MTHAASKPARGPRRGSEADSPASEPRYLAVGHIAGVHGIRGELKVDVLTDDPHRFRLLKTVLVGPDEGEPVPYGLESYRVHQKRVLLKLTGIDDREQGQALRGQLVLIPYHEALPLEEGEYYEHQIVGLEVWTVGGERLGTVSEILYSAANDVYVVQPEPAGRDILIPAIASVIQTVDLAAGRITVDLPDGLI